MCSLKKKLDAQVDKVRTGNRQLGYKINYHHVSKSLQYRYGHIQDHLIVSVRNVDGHGLHMIDAGYQHADFGLQNNDELRAEIENYFQVVNPQILFLGFSEL